MKGAAKGTLLRNRQASKNLLFDYIVLPLAFIIAFHVKDTRTGN